MNIMETSLKVKIKMYSKTDEYGQKYYLIRGKWIKYGGASWLSVSRPDLC